MIAMWWVSLVTDSLLRLTWRHEQVGVLLFNVIPRHKQMPHQPVRLCILRKVILHAVADYCRRCLQSGSLGILYAQGQIGKGVSDQLLRHGLVSTFP